MRRLTLLILVMTAAAMPLGPVAKSSSAADTANAPSLVISQLKITSSNGQFVTLYNATNSTLDMSRYQLEYFNSYDLAKSTSSRLIALSGTVPPHGYFMVNDSALLLCYQLSINSVSLGFSSTSGMVELMAFSQVSAGGPVVPVLQDYAAWSKTAAPGAQTLPGNVNAWLQRQPVDAQYNPAVMTPGAGSWQAVQSDAANPCSLVSSINSAIPISTGLNQLLPPTEPPFDIATANAVAGDSTAPATGLPAADIGLMAPQVTELLPNPAGSGNDSSQEFIELYNSNDVPFDLSSFSLQTGTTSTRKYSFPAGTGLAPKAFKAFYSAQTGLTLSNTGGQAKLMDPLGNSVSASGSYGTAKDGQSWSLANGQWYWTVSPTPDTANVIKQPATTVKGKSTTEKASGSTKTKAAKSKTKQSKLVSAALPSQVPVDKPIHYGVLAVIGGLALLYLAYEYRTDLANRIYQLRRYFGRRRGAGLEAEGRRSN